MRPEKPIFSCETDLFRSRLDQIINMRHELVRLAQTIDWDRLDEFVADRFGWKFLRTRLGRLIRDIRHRIAGDTRLTKVFAEALNKAFKIRWQKRRQQKPKVYSWHAPETECIGKGKAQKPYAFGVKVTIATPDHRSVGGQFVIHALALPGNPYDGHTLAKAIAATEAVTGQRIERVYVDKGYRGHGVKARQVFISGHRRGVFGTIKRELKRRDAVEPVIGHL
jgi:transposase, IS5 family